MVEGGTCGPRAVVQGVPTKRFVRQLQGEGFVFGIKFRPAVFPSWLGWSRAQSLSQSISKLTDKHITLLRLFGREGRVFSAAVLAASSMEARMGLAEAFLRGHGPPRSLSLSAAVAELRDLVERMATEHSLLRADDAALRLGIDLRTLQRRFQKHVGVGPKWVLQRYRLHEAVERLKQPHPPAMADLAASLGYFDQAHFARELKAMVGRAPKAFVAQLTRAAR
jgi:AraC-like DNA-binding protein